MRHTADSITDDALDELYLERDVLGYAVAKLTGVRPDEVLAFAREAMAADLNARKAAESPGLAPDVAESAEPLNSRQTAA